MVYVYKDEPVENWGARIHEGQCNYNLKVFYSKIKKKYITSLTTLIRTFDKRHSLEKGDLVGQTQEPGFFVFSH